MKKLITLLFLLPQLLLAQTNIVFTTPNSTTPGDQNVIIGNLASSTATTGQKNVVIGSSSGTYLTSGVENTFVGSFAGQTSSSGSSNTFVGANAGLYNSAGNFNTMLGYYAGLFSTNGSNNTYLGNYTGYYNTGSDNTFVGGGAGGTLGFGSGSGSRNTNVGINSGSRNLKGNDNVYVGSGSGRNNISGNKNIIIAPNSNATSYTSNNNVLLGYNAQVGDNLESSVAIGINAKVSLSNAIVLGDYTNSSIAVGIGTDSPQFPLDVRGIINLRNKGTIKFSHLINPNLRNGTTDQFLTVNQHGETVLAHYRLQIDDANQWSDKVFESGYELKPLSEVETYIKYYKHLPNVPSAEQVVKEGIDPVQINAKLLEKIEELTLYSVQQDKTIHQQSEELQVIKQKQAQLEMMLQQVLKSK